MDPVIAYLLLRNIKKERKDKNKDVPLIRKDNLSLVHEEKDRNNIKISCPRCGQNTYWCWC